MLDANDLSTMQAAIAGVLAGQQKAGKVFDPSTGNQDQFWYAVTTPAAGIAPAGVSILNIPISADADFYWNATTYQADNHASVTALTESTNPIPLVNILITDTGSNRQLMSQAVPLPTIAGDGKRPYRLLYPRRFRRTAAIQITLTNFDSALTLDVTVVFHGYKVYSNN